MTGEPGMRALQDIEDPLELLLQALRQGVDLGLAVSGMALDRVRDEDLPLLVGAVVECLPARGADDLGQLLLLQAPHLMQPYSDRLSDDRPYQRLEERWDGKRSLVLLPAHHVFFDEGVVRSQVFDDWAALRHDGGTWRPVGPEVGAGHVGGAVDGECLTCGAQLQRVIDLGTFPSPDGLDLPRELITCVRFRCLWGEQFFSHESEAPQPMVRPDREDDGIPLPEHMPVLPVSFHATSSRWQVQTWDDRQNLNRLGGPASWVQSRLYPRCPRCERKMPILAQLDGMTPFVGFYGWERWTEGMIYVFWCDDCRVSATSTQQT